MNTRNTANEVAEHLIDNGIVALKEDEEIVKTYCDCNGNLVIELCDETPRKVVVSLVQIRDVLNVNAYWETDPYSGGEKFLIVPQD